MKYRAEEAHGYHYVSYEFALSIFKNEITIIHNMYNNGGEEGEKKNQPVLIRGKVREQRIISIH